MKLVLLFMLSFALIDCQHFYAYYPPRSFNPMVHFGQIRSYQDPYSWIRFLNKPQIYLESVPKNHEDDGILGENIVGNHYERQTPLLRAHPFMQNSNKDSPAARFFFNPGNAGLISDTTSTFNFALKTLVQTTVATRTVLTTALCIPATNIGFATYCSRRRRDIEALLAPIVENEPSSLEPSPIAEMETTMSYPQPNLPSEPSTHEGSPLIDSSKTNDQIEVEGSDIGIARAKRFLITRTTLTSYSFSTTTVKRPVTITAAINGNGPCRPGAGPLSCLLSCIPPGYVVC